jgi:hypothetical protein
VSYIQLLVKITIKYRKLVENSTTLLSCNEDSIMCYLMDLHPRKYTVVGNLDISNDEENMMTYTCGSHSYG